MERTITLLLLVIIGKCSTSGDKIAELFAELANNKTYTVQSDIINNDYNSVLCWLETINLVEYKNGTSTMDRQFSVILETPGDISSTVLSEEQPEGLLNHETQKSRVLNFNNTYARNKFTLKVHRTMLCGSGSVITKEFSHWPSNKKRIQINVGSNNFINHYTLKKMNHKQVKQDKHKKRKPRTNQPHISDINPCNLSHKINVKVRVTVERKVINKLTDEVVKSAKMNVERGQDFNIKLHSKYVQGDVGENSGWESFLKLLSREHFSGVIPVLEWSPSKINAVDTPPLELTFKEDMQRELSEIQESLMECEVLQNLTTDDAETMNFDEIL